MGKQTLSVDIGGSGIKLMVLDEAGMPLTERDRKDTPLIPSPSAVISIVRELAATK